MASIGVIAVIFDDVKVKSHDDQRRSLIWDLDDPDALVVSDIVDIELSDNVSVKTYTTYG